MSEFEGLPPVNILLVDDEPANLLVLEAILDGLGARLLKARTGEEALRSLAQHEFAAVLLDIWLPGISGYETAKHIRESPRSKSTPIIFITAHDDDPSFSVRDAYALGAVDYLVKPLIPEILRTKVTVFMELYRRTQSAARAEAMAEERLASALSTVNDMFVILDRDLRFTYINDRMVQVGGIPRERIVGRHFREFLPDAAGSLFEHELRRAIDEQTPVEFEFYRASRDQWLRNRAYPSRDGLMLVSADITDAKQAAEALRQQAEKLQVSEERLRLAQRSANVGTWDLNLKTGELSWSEGHFALLGLDPGDLCPSFEEWWKFIHPDDRDEAVRLSQQAIAAAGDFNAEFRVRRGDGSYRWLSSRGSVHVADDGTPARFMGVNSDIHDRKLAELRQGLLAEAGRILGSSLDYEVTLSQVTNLVVPQFSDWCSLDLLGDAGHVIRIAVVHRDPAKVELAKLYRRRYPLRPDDRTGLMAVLNSGKPILHREITDEQLARAAHEPGQLEMLRALAVKSFIIVPMIARGRILGGLTLAFSESTRSFGDDDLRLAEELASRAALAVDNAKLFSEAQEAAMRREEALQLHRSLQEQLTLLVEASGSLSASLELPSVLDAVLQLSSRLIAADACAVWRSEPVSGRWAIAHSSGLSERFAEATIQAGPENVSAAETMIVEEDVMTELLPARLRKACEIEGIRSLLYVPLKVRGKTTGSLGFYYRQPHKFSEVELRVATALANLAGSAIGIAELYDELKQSDRRKDEFLAMLAHELRNPLSAIASGAMLLHRPEIDEPGREWATAVITRQVKHLARLMDDLLDVSRVSRGKIDLKRQRIELAPIIHQAAQTTQAVFSERKHHLSVSLEPTGLHLDADPIRLEQIIVNLLENAAKYTESGGNVWLTVRRDGDHVAISVKDNGIGIPPEQLPRMFELFAQGNPSLARSEGGLGIGLTLVKLLAELHGGHATANSEGPGKGSEFVVRLPAAKSQPSPPQEPGKSATTSHTSSRKILIIDDNVDTARGLARLLQLIGHDMKTAHTGPEGIDAARDFHPDVVLLDIGLPGMDGYEVARRLRADRELAGVRIVAITGYGQDEDRKRSTSAGIDYHLVKPIDHQTLVTLLAER
jgi:PAS domain S-box-containing protein